MSYDATTITVLAIALIAVPSIALVYWCIPYDNDALFAKESTAIDAPPTNTVPEAKCQCHVEKTPTSRPNLDMSEVKLQFTTFFSLANCGILVLHNIQLASKSLAIQPPFSVSTNLAHSTNDFPLQTRPLPEAHQY
jgi:hypothetical protein